MGVVNFIANINVKWVDYPVGSNMPMVIEVAKPLAFEIANHKDSYADGVNLWVRGSSGAILGAVVSAELAELGVKSNVAHVKKEGEESHESSVCYEHGFEDFILDDFVSSGATIDAIIKEMKNCERPSPFILVVTQHNMSDTKMTEWIYDFPTFEDITTVISGGDFEGEHEV